MEGDSISAEGLLNAIRAIKAENPDFGIKRVWTTLTEKQGMVVSEKRVKKFMQDNGCTNAEGASGGEGREPTAEQQKRNAREKQSSKTVNADSGKKASGSGSTKSKSITFLESEEEDDPFVCDVTGALISMIKDGRYHFNDGRPPDDPSAVCMVNTRHPKHMHTNAITLMTDVLPTIHLQSAL